MANNPPDNQKQILNDLDNLRGLLDEDDEKDSLSDLPVLGTEDTAPETNKGAADDQLPLLQPEAGTPAETPKKAQKTNTNTTNAKTGNKAGKSSGSASFDAMKDALASRENPFLKNIETKKTAGSKKRTTKPEQNPAPNETAATKKAPQSNTLTETQINQLIDRVVEECLPHIEQTLRVHLTAAMHKQNRQG